MVKTTVVEVAADTGAVDGTTKAVATRARTARTAIRVAAYQSIRRSGRTKDNPCNSKVYGPLCDPGYPATGHHRSMAGGTRKGVPRGAGAGLPVTLLRGIMWVR